MCHERWMRRETRREQRFDDELRRLIEERPRPNRPMPVVEDEIDEEPKDPERVRVRAGTRA